MAELLTGQLDLLRRMSSLDPPVCVMGGFAEDASLGGRVTRPHVDVDWLFPRQETELRLTQARELGFADFETVGEAAPGEPFYLFGQHGDLKIDIGIADEEDGALWVKVHRLFFTIDDEEPPAGYRLQLPPDTFDQPRVELEGIPVWTASPLALYQLRVGIAGQGSFGPLSDRHLETSRALRSRFFPDRSDADIEPLVERLGD